MKYIVISIQPKLQLIQDKIEYGNFKPKFHLNFELFKFIYVVFKHSSQNSPNFNYNLFMHDNKIKCHLHIIMHIYKICQLLLLPYHMHLKQSLYKLWYTKILSQCTMKYYFDELEKCL